MSKRSRASQSDDFDQFHYPKRSPSTSIPNNSFKPCPAVFDDANVVVVAANALGYISTSGFPKECFYCNAKFKEEDNIYIYKWLAFCKQECCEVQIAFDANVMKTRLKTAKKMDN